MITFVWLYCLKIVWLFALVWLLFIVFAGVVFLVCLLLVLAVFDCVRVVFVV